MVYYKDQQTPVYGDIILQTFVPNLPIYGLRTVLTGPNHPFLRPVTPTPGPCFLLN